MASEAVVRVDAGLPPVLVSPGFVGRDRELALLDGALARPPAVVLVEGEAGIGKSRLVRELLTTRSADRRCLVAVCPPYREPLTLGPIVDAVRHATGGVRGLALSGLAGALRPVFPEWADELPPAPEPVEDATAARHRLFRALTELLGALDTAVLVVEDAHWADEATLELLLFVTSRSPSPVSLVVTYRPEDVAADSLLRRLSSRPPAGLTQVRLALDPLAVDDTARLVSSMLAGERVSDEFVTFLHERTEGVPLAVEESMRLLAERADLARYAGRWIRRRLSDLVVPPSVRDAVLERVERLAPHTRAVLRAAAVLTEPAGEAMVAAVSGLDADAVRDGLSEATGYGLLSDDGRGRVAYRHALASRAVYEATPAPERRLLHRRAGEALAGLAGPPAAQLARHFREAGDTARWCEYAERAADLALTAGDSTTSGVLLHELVTGASLPAASVLRLANKMVLLSFRSEGRLRDVARVLGELLRSEGLAGDEEARARFQLGRMLLVLDEIDPARTELERAAAQLPAGSLEATRAVMLLAWPQGGDWPASRHLEWLRRAAEVTAPLPPMERLRLQVDRATTLLMLGEDTGWVEADRLPAGEPEPPQRLQVTRGHGNIGEAAMQWGRYDLAAQHLARAVELADAHGYLRLRESGVVTLAHLDWFTGHWDGLLERAGELAGSEDAPPMARLEATLVTGLLYAARGERAEAEVRLRRVLTECLDRGAVEYAPEPAAALARLCLAGGAADEALRVVDQPAEAVARKRIWLWATELAVVRVDALLAAGRAGAAAEFVAAFADGLCGRTIPAAEAALATCRALLAENGSDCLSAAGAYGSAAEAWQALPRPYDALLARERQAGCLLAAGEAGEAVAVLTDAFTRLSGLGATSDADRVASRLRQQGVDARRDWRRGRRGYGSELSPRELEVVRLVATGQTNREIAAALARSPKTVAGQLSSAMRKLDVSSRAALAARAVETGVAEGQ